MTLLHQAAQKAVEALTDARNEIQWWVNEHGCCMGHESRVIEKVHATLTALESALQQQPEPVALAEIDRDTDGELLIDWSPGPGRMVTLSLRDDGRLSYAVTWGAERVHGTAQMPALQHQEEPREPVAGEQDCETCQGDGTIDERLGGYSFSNPAATCPDCDGTGRVTLSASPSTTRQQEVPHGQR